MAADRKRWQPAEGPIGNLCSWGLGWARRIDCAIAPLLDAGGWLRLSAGGWLRLSAGGRLRRETAGGVWIAIDDGFKQSCMEEILRRFVWGLTRSTLGGVFGF